MDELRIMRELRALRETIDSHNTLLSRHGMKIDMLAFALNQAGMALIEADESVRPFLLGIEDALTGMVDSVRDDGPGDPEIVAILEGLMRAITSRWAGGPYPEIE